MDRLISDTSFDTFIEGKKLITLDDNYDTYFYPIFKKIQGLTECTYLVYILENLIENTRIIYNTNWEWHDLLINKKMIYNCPVFRYGYNLMTFHKRNYVFMPWNYIKPTTKDQKEVVGIRNELNIANGFGFSQQKNGFRESFALGADIKHTDFHMQFSINPNLIKIIVNEIRMIGKMIMWKKLLTKKIAHEVSYQKRILH